MGIMLGRFGKTRPDAEVILITPQRVEISTGRNIAVNRALLAGCDYIFFLDDDTICHPDTLDRLITRLETTPDIHMISPMYRIRGYPYRLMAFEEDGLPHKWKLLDEPYKADTDGLIRCIAIGNGCTMVRMDVYRRILAMGDNDEWYRTGKHHTEDAYFCAKARQAMPEFTCAIDTTFHADHMLGVTWINEDNLRWLRLKVRLVSALMKDPGLFDKVEALVSEEQDIDQLAVLEYDGSIGRL